MGTLHINHTHTSTHNVSPNCDLKITALSLIVGVTWLNSVYSKWIYTCSSAGGWGSNRWGQ